MTNALSVPTIAETPKTSVVAQITLQRRFRLISNACKGIKKVAKMIFTLLSLFITGSLSSQDSIRPLNIGDKVPDILMKNIINYPGGKAKISDFKGKFIILDFWNRGCLSCIGGFPKMEKLQQKYYDRIQILAVTIDSTHALSRLLKNSTIVKNTKLPLVIEDKTLHDLFPHRIVPYHVWIDSSRVVRFMTHDYNATEENIDKFISGGTLDLSYLYNSVDFDHNKSLLFEGHGRQLRNIKYHSIITNHITGTNTPILGLLRDSSTSEYVGFKVYNNDILQLFRNIFSVNRGYIVLELKNPDTYFQPSDPNKIDNWRSDKNYSYEIMLPLNNLSLEKRINKWYAVAKRDIQNYFGIIATKEVRPVKCVVLKRLLDVNEEHEAISYIKGKDAAFERYENIVSFINYPIEAFISSIYNEYEKEYNHTTPIFLSDLDQEEYLNIRLTYPLTDLKSLNIQLRPKGLEFIETVRNIEVLVLKEEY